MKSIIISILFFGLASITYAQKEANNWLFGQNAGLTWNTTRSANGVPVGGTAGGTLMLEGLPTVIPSNISTNEGCFSLSTNQGLLLMYSDGERIWDRTNTIMPNGSGMQGSYSAAQSGIVLPYPGQENKYIGVSIGIRDTPPASFASPHYSVIDMTLPGNGTFANPLGDVVPGQKNIKFTGALGITGESVTSVLHTNEVDYWVIAPGRGAAGAAYLNAWLITTAGPQTTNPVITPLPLPVDLLAFSYSGYIKFTPDGRHFAWANNRDLVIYGDFDPATGQFSNLKYISYNPTIGPYGVEFSPSMKYLYIGGMKTLFVYDLDVLVNWPTVDATSAPRKVFDVGVDYNGLQLASDGRIYVTAFNTHFLYIVTNPNEYDDLKIYELPSDFLGAGFSKVGLPSFLASWFMGDVQGQSLACMGNASTYTAGITMSGTAFENAVKLVWNFGDGTPTVDQSVTLGITTYQQSHVFSAAGEYTVTATPYRSNNTPLEALTYSVRILDCSIMTNRMVRTRLVNKNLQQ